MLCLAVVTACGSTTEETIGTAEPAPTSVQPPVETDPPAPIQKPVEKEPVVNDDIPVKEPEPVVTTNLDDPIVIASEPEPEPKPEPAPEPEPTDDHSDRTEPEPVAGPVTVPEPTDDHSDRTEPEPDPEPEAPAKAPHADEHDAGTDENPAVHPHASDFDAGTDESRDAVEELTVVGGDHPNGIPVEQVFPSGIPSPPVIFDSVASTPGDFAGTAEELCANPAFGAYDMALLTSHRDLREPYTDCAWAVNWWEWGCQRGAARTHFGLHDEVIAFFPGASLETAEAELANQMGIKGVQSCHPDLAGMIPGEAYIWVPVPGKENSFISCGGQGSVVTREWLGLPMPPLPPLCDEVAE